MAAGHGRGPAGGQAGRNTSGDAGTLTGGAWLAALPDELAAQRHVMAGLTDRCQAWPLARSLLVGCSLGRCAADALSDVREWAFLGWGALIDTDKYLRRGSLWEAHNRLHQARHHIWALWAAAHGALYPWHGLSQVLDHDPGNLPPGIESTIAGLDAADLRRAARASAEVLATASAAAALRHPADLPTAMAAYVTRALSGPGAPGPRNHGPLWVMVIVRAMTRIPYVRREELGPEGQQLWDSIVNGLGDLVMTADGGLAGPFNAFVTAPGAGRRLASLGTTLRFGTSIERRLSEIAIITIGARWQAEFEWWAHAPMAREHGVAGAVVDAIGRGEDPPFEADDERAVYAAARQLGHSGRLDQETYDAAHRFLGDAGMVELVSLCGYYTLVSFLLNALVVPLPPDATPMWAGS